MGNTASHTVAGHTSAAASSVTIDEVPATITSGTNFSASVPMPGSTNVVAVVAQPSAAGGTAATQFYQIVNSGGTLIPLTYDADGNCTQDENGNKYQWDALNRMTKITYPNGTTSNFAYDGLSRRVSIVEKNAGGGVVTTKNYLWIGSEMAEERDASNNVTKRFFPQGEQQIVGSTATPYYYTRDHLGSVREMLNSSGSIVARYSYDPYGRTTLVSGSNLATFQYTDFYTHQPSGLNLTKYRAYDSNTGRWLSRDPISENGGINLYGYVHNDPDNGVDPLGLDPVYHYSPTPPSAFGNTANAGTYVTNLSNLSQSQAMSLLGIGPPNYIYTIHVPDPANDLDPLFPLNAGSRLTYQALTNKPLPVLSSRPCPSLGGSGTLFSIASVIPYLFGGGASEDWGAIKAFATGGPQGFMDYEQAVTDFYNNQNAHTIY